MSGFDWHDSDAVIIRHQVPVAVYQNLNGDIVIRGERAWDEEDDQVVIVAPDHVPRLVSAILQAAGLDAENAPHALPKSADFAQKPKNGVGNISSTML